MNESKARVRFIEQAITAQEEERARIARELHDGIGQSLTSLLVGLRSLESTLGVDSKAGRLAAQLRETAGKAMDEVRSLAQGLRPMVLDDLGLPAAVDRLVEELSIHHSIVIDVEVGGMEAEPRLSPPVEITIYRILQEALHNVVKHAHASRASIVLERRGEVVRLIVEDNGKGMEEEGGDGTGLQGIRERLALIKGELVIESTPGEGTTLFATIPCPSRVLRRFSLRHEDGEVPLPPGEYVIGRSDDCDLRLERRRVSRRHAKLLVGDYEIYVEDLGSMNGVFVNGRRVDSVHRLRDGDGVVIGDEHLEIRAVSRGGRGEESSGFGLERTLPGHVGGKTQDRARDVTERADMLEIAGAMAIRCLEEGRVADAERMLSGHLRQVIDAVRAGESVRESVAETSIAYAFRLAQATRSVSWARYALEIMERLRIGPTEAVLSFLEAMVWSGVQVPQDGLRAYLAALEGDEGDGDGASFQRLRNILERC